jgi:hypothetical protein
MLFINNNPFENPGIKKEISETYIKQFFVGLLEGDGTITVDIPKSRQTVRLRFFISLKNLPDNHKMLLSVRNVVGGKVLIERQEKYVTWSATTQQEVNKILDILNKYPLLTSRKQCQLNFGLIWRNQKLSCGPTKESIPKKTYTQFLLDRENKYTNVPKYVEENSKKKLPPYFKAWLSGFIEAESHFKLLYRPTGGISQWGFSIGQNNDYYILQNIKNYFESYHKITLDKNKNNTDFSEDPSFDLIKAGITHGIKAGINHGISQKKKKKLRSFHYRISIYGHKCRQKIIEHLNEYPLLGDKKNSYIRWLTPYKNLN